MRVARMIPLANVFIMSSSSSGAHRDVENLSTRWHERSAGRHSVAPNEVQPSSSARHESADQK
jgi:hypothetical protein